jgi:DNA-binding response OmpR family regulator
MKILVVDDDPIMTELLRLILKSTAEVFVAHSGADGVGLAREQAPDLIILDTLLPDLDGIQVCQAVREFSRVPILILSALDTSGSIAAALKMGANDYLVKPVSCKILLVHIERLVRSSQAEAVEQPAAINQPADGKSLHAGFHALVER